MIHKEKQTLALVFIALPAIKKIANFINACYTCHIIVTNGLYR